MTVLGWAGAALACASVAFLLRSHSKDTAAVISALAGVALTGAAVSALAPALTFLGEAAEETPLDGYLPVLLKALAVAAVTSITADICRDTGDSSIAGRVELFGRVQIVLLSIPLARELIALASSLST